MFGAAAILRLLSVLVFYVAAIATGHPGHFDLADPVYYDRWAWYVGEHLRQGQLVDIRVGGLAGTYDVGLEYFVGLQYAIVGHQPVVARAVDAILAGACAPLVYIAGRGTVIGERASRTAGWLMAFWPLSIYWAGYDLIKEPVVCVLIAVAMVAITARSRILFVGLGVAATIALAFIRAYTGLGTFILIPASALFRRDWRSFLGIAAALLLAEAGLVATGQPALYSFIPYTGNGQPFKTDHPTTDPGSVYNVVGGAGLQKAEGGSDATSVLHLPPRLLAVRLGVGTLITLLGPRPALKDILHPTIDTWMYPGMLVWIPLIPFTVLGFVRATRRRDPTEISLALMSLGLLFSLSFFFGGVFRQREMIWPPTLLFTASGLHGPFPRHWRTIFISFLALGLLLLAARELASYLL
jgi:hypothetical protein